MRRGKYNVSFLLRGGDFIFQKFGLIGTDIQERDDDFVNLNEKRLRRVEMQNACAVKIIICLIVGSKRNVNFRVSEQINLFGVSAIIFKVDNAQIRFRHNGKIAKRLFGIVLTSKINIATEKNYRPTLKERRRDCLI